MQKIFWTDDPSGLVQGGAPTWNKSGGTCFLLRRLCTYSVAVLENGCEETQKLMNLNRYSSCQSFYPTSDIGLSWADNLGIDIQLQCCCYWGLIGDAKANPFTEETQVQGNQNDRAKKREFGLTTRKTRLWLVICKY